MSRTCTICSHARRSEIEAAVVGAQSLRNVAKTFGVSLWAVRRHKEKHLPAHLAQAQQAADVLNADKLLKALRDLQSRALRLLGKAEKAGDLRGALAGIRETRATIEAAASLLAVSDLEQRIARLEQTIGKQRKDQ